MPTKQQLLAHLEHIRSLVSSEESDEGAIFWMQHHLGLGWPLEEAARHNHRFRRIERMLEEALSRPGATCQFQGEDGAAVARLIVGMGPQARGEAHQHLGEIVAGAREITICDPYLLQPYASAPPKDYVTSLLGLLPNGLKTLEIFVKPRVRNREVADEFNRVCRSRSIRVVAHKTEQLHDRVWIADHERAYTVGTSFNGLGNRCAFILPLPPEDRRAFMRELSSIRNNASRSRGA